MSNIKKNAITLLRCAADLDPPSLVEAIGLCGVSDASHKLAFAAVDKADPDYGGGFLRLYVKFDAFDTIEDARAYARQEAMRHCFLEAAQILEDEA